MSKTYREVFDDDVEEINVKKIKHIDRKHQKAKVTDGACRHGLYDEDGDYFGNNNSNKVVYKTLENKVTAVTEILGHDDAKRIIQKSIDSYNELFNN